MFSCFSFAIKFLGKLMAKIAFLQIRKITSPLVKVLGNADRDARRLGVKVVVICKVNIMLMQKLPGSFLFLLILRH